MSRHREFSSQKTIWTGQRHLIRVLRWLLWNHAKLRLEIIHSLPERAKNQRSQQGQTLLLCGTTTNNSSCWVSWLRCWARCQAKLFSVRLEGPGVPSVDPCAYCSCPFPFPSWSMPAPSKCLEPGRWLSVYKIQDTRWMLDWVIWWLHMWWGLSSLLDLTALGNVILLVSLSVLFSLATGRVPTCMQMRM